MDLRALVHLTRPRTLPAAICPVSIAIAYAYRMGAPYWWDAFLCLLVASGAQIASNVANDYYDYMRGADTAERIGPTRPLSRGLVSRRFVLTTLLAALGITIFSGVILSYLHSWWLIGVGLAVCMGAIGYSAGPFPLSYLGLGDCAVLVFFGIVPTVFGGYVMGIPLSDTTLWLLAIAVGLANVCILVVNNYRDYEEDKQTGKRTSIVRFGRRFGRFLYLACGFGAVLMVIISNVWALGFGLLIPYLTLHLINYRDLSHKNETELNALIGRSALGVFVLTITIMLFISQSPMSS